MSTVEDVWIIGREIELLLFLCYTMFECMLTRSDSLSWDQGTLHFKIHLLQACSFLPWKTSNCGFFCPFQYSVIARVPPPSIFVAWEVGLPEENVVPQGVIQNPRLLSDVGNVAFRINCPFKSAEFPKQRKKQRWFPCINEGARWAPW